MPDVEVVITQGIGSAPGSIKFFVLYGLDTNPAAASVIGDATASDAARFHARGADAAIYHVKGSDSSG